MNHCIFTGNLTDDPACKTITSKESGKEHKVLNFTIGVNDRRNKEVCFPDFQAWGTGAEMIERYFKKGSLIRVYARMVTDRWKDEEDGKNRYRNYFRVESFEFPELNMGKNGGVEADAEPEEKPTPKASKPAKPAKPAKQAKNVEKSPPIEDDDDEDSIEF